MARPLRNAPKKTREIGVRLRKLRLEREAREGRRITQAEVAKATETDIYRVNAYECGRKEPTPPILERFADYYGVTLDYLIRGGNLERTRLVAAIDDEIAHLVELLISVPRNQREAVRTVLQAFARKAGADAPAAQPHSEQRGASRRGKRD